MSKSLIVFVTALGISLALPLRCVAAQLSVVLITIDTLRADHLSTYGYRRQTSPSLDRLASEGALFETVYSAANSTRPSHTSILTGTHVTSHGVLSNQHRFSRDDLPTLAERFKRAGYATAAVVSTVELNREPSGLGRAFDRYVDADGTERPAEATIALAIASIAKRADRPFFLWVHLIDPHMPYNPPAPYDRQFASGNSRRIDVILGRKTDADLPRASRSGPDPDASPEPTRTTPFIDSIGLNRIGLTRDEIEYLTALYDGEIAYTDAALGKLFAVLRGDRAPDTLVVVTADHGESFGEHGVVYCEHSTIYEETLRVPLILWEPRRIPAGSRVRSIASGVDIAPTVLDYAGLPLDEVLEGRSLRPLIAGGGAPDGVPIFADHERLYASMVRDGEWKLILSRPATKERALASASAADWYQSPDRIARIHPKPFELYNLVDDPHEEHDVAGTHPEIVQRLLRLRSVRMKQPE